jgi:transcriptional regulator with XRE-family HTH domain
VPRNKVTEAVRDLRNRLGDTQQQFANRLGMAISTIVRYELSRPPRGRVLADLENLAVNNGCSVEAAVFRNALYEEFPLVFPESTLLAPFSYLRLTPRNDREEELVQALLWAARYPVGAMVLQSVEQYLKDFRIAKAQFESAINDAAEEYLCMNTYAEDGLSPQEIAKKSEVAPERVRLWLKVRKAFGTNLQSIRALLQGIGLGESDTGLAASFKVPIATVRALKKHCSDFGIPIIG